jgi:hypothetical protein
MVIDEIASPRRRDLTPVPQWTATGRPVVKRLAETL